VETSGSQAEDDEDTLVGAEPHLLGPFSAPLDALLGVNSSEFSHEQKSDDSLKRFWILAQGSESTRTPRVKYVVRNGILFRKFHPKRSSEVEQLVVPTRYRASLLRVAHDNAFSGHLGVNKTKTRLLQQFYWPRCFKDSERYVQSCDTCQRVGKANEKTKAPMKLVPLIKEPFQRLIVDIVGPLPRTLAGNRYILTLLCPATKFPEAVPLDVASSQNVVDALLEVFARLGFPKELQSDRGTVFTSALTTTFLQRCGIRVIHSSVHHPQSNAVERIHSVMKRLLRALCFEQKAEWDRCLPATMFALRTIPNASTGFAPAELVFGRNLRTPLRIVRENWESNTTDVDQNVVDYVLKLTDHLGKCRELAQANMAEAQLISKGNYDRGTHRKDYQKGDSVMVLKTSRKNKLEVQWDGPLTVLEKVSDTNYIVRQGRKEAKTYHVNLMKPYVQRVESLCITLTEQQMTEEEDELDNNTWDGASNNPPLPDDLSSDKLDQLGQLVNEFKDVFSTKPGRTNLVEFDIELSDERQLLSRP
jgi:hypothetical protein